jgi:hypothetical protein
MIENIFLSVSPLFLSIAMLFLTYATWRVGRKIFSVPVVVDLIFFFIFVKIIFYYFIPAIMRIMSDYKFVREDGVTIIDIIFIYSIEFISWVVWLMVLLGVFRLVKKNNKKIGPSEFCYINYYESIIFLALFALGFIATRIFTLIGTEPNLFIEVFKSLFFYAGLATGPFLMVLGLRYYGKIIFLLGLCSSLVAILSFSTRGVLFYTILFSFFLVWFILRDKKSKIIIFSVIITITAIYFTLGGLISGSIIIDESGNVSVDAFVASEKKGTRSIIEEIEWRFGASTRMGTALINLYERGEAAGINPIKHSLMGFLPRVINPDKPHPSTMNGDDIYSQGMYIIYREINGYNTNSMVEFPTGAHFYWEFGIIGVLTLSAISGLYVALCANFFSKLGLVAIPLMVAIFKPWGYVDPKIWVSDIAMQIYQIILPLISLIFIFRFWRYGIKFLKQGTLYSEKANYVSKQDVVG